jgi:hypothetical protein
MVSPTIEVSCSTRKNEVQTFGRAKDCSHVSWEQQDSFNTSGRCRNGAPAKGKFVVVMPSEPSHLSPRGAMKKLSCLINDLQSNKQTGIHTAWDRSPA